LKSLRSVPVAGHFRLDAPGTSGVDSVFGGIDIMDAYSPPRLLTAGALATGALLGMAGTFASSVPVRSLAWGIDGTLLVVGVALLAVHHLRLGHELMAAGFLVFLAGETLIVSGSAMDLAASAPTFAAGAGLWSAGMLLVSASNVQPLFVRSTGVIAALLFAATSGMIFAGGAQTPLSKPLPFFAYPFLAFTLFGWAATHLKNAHKGRDASQ
jgi:hypothetical protein